MPYWYVLLKLYDGDILKAMEAEEKITAEWFERYLTYQRGGPPGTRNLLKKKGSGEKPKKKTLGG